jgi:cation diffusion facilitator CzcD-associated flavoprotein CzcO
MSERTRIAIIGAGLSGLCVASALLRAGIDDFVMLDRGDEVGGTWRDNTYPGCACDIPSVLYSFSWAPNAGWSRFFAGQGEILAYTRSLAEREGILGHIRFGAEVRSAAWDADARRWQLDTAAGPLEAQVVVAGAGPWHEPRLPDLPGLSEFTGTVFHSSRWDHDHDLSGRRVAVIGTGASAVQFVPEIQPQVEHLTVFQRTPHWVLPKPDRSVSPPERLLLRFAPGAGWLAREGVFNLLEAFNAGMHHPQVMRQLQRLGELNLRLGVRDAELRAQLTPDFTLGCKRVLMSNDWYPALTRPNVTVVPAAVTAVGDASVIDARGGEHEVDTIILGTGFKILDMPVAELITGSDGMTLSETWQGSPRGYLGTAVSGFPNAFVMLGPNIGINTSATVLMELQAAYIVDAVRTMEREQLEVVEVRSEVQSAFNDEVDAGLAGTVWNRGGCRSYFIDETGRNGFSYPWTARDLRRRMKRFDPADYDLRPAREHTLVA